MPKLFVIPGHGAGDPGAGGYGFNEAERVRALASKMKELAPNDVILGDFNRNYYADKGISSLSLPNDTVIIELHMDSATGVARGGHVIIKSGYSPDQWDLNLASNISKMFPGRSNSIVGRSDLGNVNRAASRGFNYRLLEVCFISNYEDLTKFNNNLGEVAKTILSAFGIGTTQATPAPYVPHGVQAKDYVGSSYQKWWMRGSLKDGEIVSLRNAGNWLWLSDPGSSKTAAKAETWGGTGGEDGNADPRDPQLLIVEATDRPGVWKLHPKVAPHLSLDTNGNSPDSGTLIQWWENNESEAQLFFFFEVVPNLFKIYSVSGMKPLTVV